MEVWSARDRFVPLAMRVVESSSLLLKDFLLAWFGRPFQGGRFLGYYHPEREKQDSLKDLES